MLQRTPKSGFWKFIKGSAKTLFVIEAVLFAASYGIWYRLNTNREFRHYMRDNYPSVLEGYYKVGEILGNDNQTRQIDYSVWTKESKETKRT